MTGVANLPGLYSAGLTPVSRNCQSLPGLLRPNLLGSRVAHSASTAILTMDGVTRG